MNLSNIDDDGFYIYYHIVDDSTDDIFNFWESETMYEFWWEFIKNKTIKTIDNKLQFVEREEILDGITNTKDYLCTNTPVLQGMSKLIFTTTNHRFTSNDNDCIMGYTTLQKIFQALFYILKNNTFYVTYEIGKENTDKKKTIKEYLNYSFFSTSFVGEKDDGFFVNSNIHDLLLKCNKQPDPNLFSVKDKLFIFATKLVGRNFSLDYYVELNKNDVILNIHNWIEKTSVQGNVVNWSVLKSLIQVALVSSESQLTDKEKSRIKKVVSIFVFDVIFQGKPINQFLIRSIDRGICHKMSLRKNPIFLIKNYISLLNYNNDWSEFMTIDNNTIDQNTDRNYTLGRIWALYERIENYHAYKHNHKAKIISTKITKFKMRPTTVLGMLDGQLQSRGYFDTPVAEKLKNKIGKLIASIELDNTPIPVNSQFFVGYYHQCYLNDLEIKEATDIKNGKNNSTDNASEKSS